jgi:hypothetical protein
MGGMWNQVTLLFIFVLRMKTIVFIGTSLDGFIARTDGDFDWLSRFANDEAIRAYEELIERIVVRSYYERK